MNNLIGFECVECARRSSVGEVEYLCSACGGNLDALHDYEIVAKQLSEASLASDRNLTIWRYRALLPLEELSRVPPLAVGWTPIYECKRLADQHGVKRLLIKDEGRNPTASFKDRPSALAGMCASVGMESVIFVPAAAPPAKIAQLLIYRARVVLVEGSYDDAYELCIAAARRHGWYQRSTGYNPFMTEGKKTAALEIAEQLNWDVPDRVFVAVGDDCIIGGLWKGFNDLRRLGFIDRLPQMIGVQAETASAVVEATNGDGVVREGAARTVADSISVGKSRDATKAIRAIWDSSGSGVKVSDDEIIASITRLARSTGVFAEPAGAAAFGGFVKIAEAGALGSDEGVLLVVTGAGLKDVDAARRAVAEPLRVRPDLDQLDALLKRTQASCGG